jgi:hypothetical protein
VARGLEIVKGEVSSNSARKGDWAVECGVVGDSTGLVWLSSKMEPTAESGVNRSEAFDGYRICLIDPQSQYVFSELVVRMPRLGGTSELLFFRG